MSKIEKSNLLTRKEAAEYLGITTHTLNIWAFKKQNLPYYKVGKLTKYKLSELRDFVNNSKQEVNQHKNRCNL
jgi:excisionase family DNA binding protein